MKKEFRLRKREDFKKVYQYGHSIANRSLVLYELDNIQIESYRFGISVSKKLGKAVVRNRVKRLIKEAIRSVISRNEIKKHKDYIFIARKPIIEMDLEQIEKSIEYLFNKKHLIIRK
ncbi:ribonuclease P protein component [Tepidibacillus fermentans]|uniref:Ribonuclease P protein component n=1 Tax=Tepidibacillus fermentans TaxID=1281767 RepID=A0A4V2USB8_9BACI|nr:ribonuclease P protein component [Tepidibacillus fermentans]TCS80822.1 ribonuclease P protein component [Tepidibacillus fermentans]